MASPISLIVAVVAELAMGRRGARRHDHDGNALYRLTRRLRRHIAIAVVGSLLIKAMELIRRRVLVWQAEAA